METQSLKKYAPEARKAFIKAVTDQAALYGFSKNRMEPMKMDGQTAIIGGRAFPASVAWAREALEKRIKASGFEQVMESIAYTWFNRFVAIRYMELHGYLDHGYQALGWGAGGRPEILDHAVDLDLPGLKRERVIELKLDGSKDEELYRLLLLAQCNALNQSMPFLFEKIGDETELLLPANLLHTDSLIRQLVEQIDEGLWAEIEIIGWLYQFYISEKKDQVIGKVVKSEDIPAATQLFTPNWIVKYMVQNSLGAQWLATYPQSPLRGQMEYYIEPAEQTDEVKAQLAAITPDQLNPEELTLIDPASGSGHILVEAYGLFKAIYLERGYRLRDVPQLILERNLFGLDIDERAAQLTGFALMMKGREDDRRLFERGVKLNVMALVDSAGFDAEGLANGVALSDYGLMPEDLTELKRLFEHATTFGSLIQVPEGLAGKLPGLKQLGEVTSQDLFVSEALQQLGPLVQQAELLAGRYDAVVMNPPYMGGKTMPEELKKWARDKFSSAKLDVYGMFIERTSNFARQGGRYSLITMQAWMFLSSCEGLRKRIFESSVLTQMFHTGPGVFPELGAFNVVTTSFVLFKHEPISGYSSCFIKADQNPEVAQKLHQLKNTESHIYLDVGVLNQISGFPLAYSLSPNAISNFSKLPLLGDICPPRQGMATTDNGRFLRRWNEIAYQHIAFGCSTAAEGNRVGKNWFPYNKSGNYRKWYGNNEHVVLYEDDGNVLLKVVSKKYPRISDPEFVIKNREHYFREGLVYSLFGFENFGVRYKEPGFIFDVSGSSLFPKDRNTLKILLAYLASSVAFYYLKTLAPTVNFQVGDLARLPVPQLRVQATSDKLIELANSCIELCRTDWDMTEGSWGFSAPRLLLQAHETLPASWTIAELEHCRRRDQLRDHEEQINASIIDELCLQGEVSPSVNDRDLTIKNLSKQDTMEELVSYAIGCMMGRYSLDEPGLIYAHSGNEGFDSSRYPTFPADADGIIPLTDTEWFEDDATRRLIEFINVAFNPSNSKTNHLEKNLTFLAENLGPKKNETSRETLRRYLCDSFFKNHLQTYKNRPIYWLFTSGKQKAFQCLVYLHRYNTGTLSRIRTEYVIPLQGKMAHRLDTLNEEIASAGSSSRLKTLTQERDKLSKQQEELRLFDEQLRHYADQRIHLDLDDGVKVNYGKFGNLLAEKKKVTGK